MKYWVERWSALRKKEMVLYPEYFSVHEEYLKICPEDELRNGFAELFRIMQQIYEDAEKKAEELLLPLHDMKEYRYLSKEERLSRGASYKYARILFALGCVGELNGSGELHINVREFKAVCKNLQITGINECLVVLKNYGFIFDGLVRGKMKEDSDLILQYPDNRNLPCALHILAVKTRNTDRMKDFYRLNYKLFKDDWDTADFGHGVDFVADVLSGQEQETAHLIHEELMNRGFFINFQEWNEGPQIRYFKKEADSKKNINASFWLASMDAGMRLFFRIKDMEKGMGLIKNASEHVIQNFLVSDPGCANRFAGRCKAGVSYELNGKSIWRCGCCNPNFQVVPGKEDYMFYIDLVDLTGKR